MEVHPNKFSRCKDRDRDIIGCLQSFLSETRHIEVRNLRFSYIFVQKFKIKKSSQITHFVATNLKILFGITI